MRVFDHRKLVQLRERAGIDRSRFAVDIGRGYPSILKYESGAVTPPTDVLVRIADRLSVPVDDLFTDAPKAVA